ncbi:zinc metalloprotease [Levilactobacillus enshiensis]|uniref:hypothetical protein n=1 Tax=Levilactobacillus enshiensis TaxID=2590213 RepID=UPI001CDB58D0|nr:hypothetical protein [Levilactobacillus enshiensis]
MLWKRLMQWGLAAASLSLVVLGMTGLNGRENPQPAAKQSIKQDYQRTATYSPPGGRIDQHIYSQKQLRALTAITHGSQYRGNTSLDAVATQHVYQLNGRNLANIVGNDGVLQLYNDSHFMTTRMVKDAAGFWNRVAGTQVVEVVAHPDQSDEIIHDGKRTQPVLGGQTYNGKGILFYPGNWRIQNLSQRNQQNWKEAALIHEIGHALGIPHLGGGPLGTNAAKAGVATVELMAVWSVGRAGSPPENELGVKSTSMDAATLALAGLSWQHPRRLAGWVLQTQRVVLYDNGHLTTINKSK